MSVHEGHRQRKKEQFREHGLDAFADQDEAHYGLNGSPTQVERIFPPPSAPPAERYEGETAAEALVERLRALKFL